jgi:hypothetical protein
VVILALVLLALATAAVVVDRTEPHGVDFGHPLGKRHHTGAGTSDNGAATTTAAVARRSLASRTTVSGTLGYAGDYTVAGRGGTITALPSLGQVIKQGHALYEVDGSPVVLLYGSTPAYRNLAEAATAEDLSGADVRQLNAALVALGYASTDDLNPSSHEFSWATKAAIRKLQAQLGTKQTGELDTGQVVFLPTAVRVATLPATLGGQAGGPVLTATSTSRQVTVDLDAGQQSQVKVGDRVTITLPNGQTTPGTVTSVGKVATVPTGDGAASHSPTVQVQITPTKPAATGTLDQAPVQVAITTDTAPDAVVVPVNALLSLATGGYAVEVVSADGGHRLVPVTLGLFDDTDGLVQVDGALSVGQLVVVPES